MTPEQTRRWPPDDWYWFAAAMRRFIDAGWKRTHTNEVKKTVKGVGTAHVTWYTNQSEPSLDGPLSLIAEAMRLLSEEV